MKAKQSDYLRSVKPKLNQLLALLQPRYEYVSVLATDVNGRAFSVSQRQTAIRDYQFGERGFVVRVYIDGGYSEYSFNDIDDVPALAAEIADTLALQKAALDGAGIVKLPTPLVKEHPDRGEFATEVPDTMYDIDAGQVIAKLKEVSDRGVAKDGIIECQATYTVSFVNKMFLSADKDLLQAYAYGTGAMVMLAAKDGETRYNYCPLSGWFGPEMIDRFGEAIDRTYDDLMVLFGAPNIIPGEYDVICPPEASGLIAHEAFGHGVEMDMFVKDRAIAKDHMGEKVASDITVMYDGPQGQQQTASYFFDDEGTMGGKTMIIDHGTLAKGMCDALSAARLGVEPTGNGRRETFERKAYTRMSNTYFQPCGDSLDAMIKSIKHGYIIDGAQSGMEDPKHWGIQCVYSRAKEIVDGRLTGRVFTPVFMTGYVPDMLKSISMIGPDIDLSGNGYCGKGYKEWVVVSTGGPYMKAKARLG